MGSNPATPTIPGSKIKNLRRWLPSARGPFFFLGVNGGVFPAGGDDSFQLSLWCERTGTGASAGSGGPLDPAPRPPPRQTQPPTAVRIPNVVFFTIVRTEPRVRLYIGKLQPSFDNCSLKCPKHQPQGPPPRCVLATRPMMGMGFSGSFST